MIHDFTKGIAVTSWTRYNYSSSLAGSVDAAYEKAREIVNFDITANVKVWRNGKVIAEFGAMRGTNGN